MGWNTAELNRRIYGDDRSYDLLRKYLKGQVKNPRGDMPQRIAVAVGLSVSELMHGIAKKELAEIVGPEEVGGQSPERLSLVADGVFIEMDDIRSDKREGVRALMAGRKAELWRLTTDVIDRVYPAGRLLVVDLQKAARPRDIVLAEVRRTDAGHDSIPIFRGYVPPRLMAASNVDPWIPVETIDDFRIIVRGVVVASV